MRLALVHGFTQTGASWEPIAPKLAADVVAPDLPGHGTKAGRQCDLHEAAAILAEEVGPAIWVGYSLGGRVCLHIALDRPDVTRGLVLVSTTAGIEDHGERAARQRADDALADDILDLGVNAFLDRWLEGPLFATLADPGLEHRLGNTPEGLSSSLRMAGTGTQDPLWDRLAEIRVPVLVITGTKDPKFTDLGRRFAGHHVQLDAGHAVPWEQPDAFAQVVNDWLHRTRPSDSSAPKTS